MSKSATSAKLGEIAETIEFPSFDASKATDQLRSFAEKGVEQSKEAYAKLKAGAEEAQKALESTYETAKSAGGELSLKTIAAPARQRRGQFRASRGARRRQVAVRSGRTADCLPASAGRTGIEQAKEFQALTAKAATKSPSR